MLYLIFQGQQLQKYKEGPNLLQKAKKSLTSSFESFMSKRVRNKANFFHNYMYLCNQVTAAILVKPFYLQHQNA